MADSCSSTTRSRRLFAAALGICVAALFTTLTIGAAEAAPFSGGFSPFIFDGRADLNGDTVVNGRDDANAFYGDTHIIDGYLDCNAWASDNDGTGGDNTIDANDDCTLIGYDGTVDGVTINVVDGSFDVNDGPLPTVFNAGDPDNNDVGDSDFAWSTINGLVDSDGNETINANDCHFGLVGETVDAGLGDATDGADVLANTVGNTNPCGFGNAPDAADTGKVDLNSDGDITSADTCTNGCFFRHNVTLGVVQEIPASAGSPAFTGGLSPTIISGKADLNYDGVVNGRDDSNNFFGDTDIIDGLLDCNAWTSDNDGTAGNGTIDSNDDCTLIGYDGTVDGVTIDVVDGEFQVGNGPLPTVYNAGDPDNADVGDSDFAWSTIGGRVDSNGNETIDANDCTFGLIGVTVDAGQGDPTDGFDVLSTDGSNQCGFTNPPDAADNGKVDLNSDGDITSADSCTDGCFFGHNVSNGLVQDSSGPPAVQDFNGDGVSDAAFGVPGEDIKTKSNAGSVNVIYGNSANGLTAAGPPVNQSVDVRTAGGSLGNGDKFGQALTAGDFDNDGFSDLAVGAPGRAGQGAVGVIYGTASGLTSTGGQLWTQGTTDVESDPESGDLFGQSVTAGDFNGDGFDDLAIGAPGEDAGAGAVNVLYGSSNGLSATSVADQLLVQGANSLDETAEAGDAFGFSLASGDLDGDGRDDLLVGVPTEDVGATADAGLIQAIYGTASGFTGADDQTFHQGTTDVESDVAVNDKFGFSVAAGDLNGDGYDDAAIGVPLEDTAPRTDNGAVNVLYGSTGTGLVVTNDQLVVQGAGGVEGTAESGDRLGFSVAIGDINNDGEADLAVGAPSEAIGTKSKAGAVNVLFGQTSGALGGTLDMLVSQDTPGVEGKAEKGDSFGVSVSIAGYNGDDFGDLNVGVFAEDLKATQRNAGAAQVLYGANSTSLFAGDQLWHQDRSGIAGKAEKGDTFGADVL